jgi:hypothetical protein
MLEKWREWAVADAESRGIPGLAPMLDGLAASLARLRAVDWVRELQKTARDGGEGSAR